MVRQKSIFVSSKVKPHTKRFSPHKSENGTSEKRAENMGKASTFCRAKKFCRKRIYKKLLKIEKIALDIEMTKKKKKLGMKAKLERQRIF